MKRSIDETTASYKKLTSLTGQALQAEKRPQTQEALLERARLNVFMENLSKLPGGISAARVEGVIRTFHGKAIPEDHTDRELLGFYEANLLLNEMLENGFDLTKENILKLYTALSKYEPEMTEEEKTGFRKKIAYTSDKSLLGHVRTIDYARPENIEPELDKLIEQCNQMKAEGVNTLAIAAIFHVEFEAIHPFKDGNGRLGRILIYGMLGKELGQNGNLVLESFILEGRDKGRYIRAMNDSRGVTMKDAGTLVYEDVSQREGSNEKFLDYFSGIYEAALKQPIKAKTQITPGGV